ncbi:MAG: three-Cys-motif partner protein TcmP [Acidobacteriota bacterium]
MKLNPMESIPGITDIGSWSEVKLEIVRAYAEKFSAVLSKQEFIKHDYIDAFAGAGFHLSRETKGIVPGSPLNALYVDPPFNELYLIDLDGNKINILRELTENRSNVHIYQGDCNEVLLEQVFPKVRYEDYRRALCLLDPYGLHLNWEVIATAGKMKSVEIFLNFPIMDMNRNVLLKKAELATERESERMTAFWGDETWRTAAYAEPAQANLFGLAEIKKVSNDTIAEAFRSRLKDVAGFRFVPKPVRVKNSIGATLYYLFFASHNETGNKIAEHILENYR